MRIEPEEARRAIQEGEFIPWFQPLVVLRTGQLAGFEVLARWKHPEFGFVSPDIFIPFAERDDWIDDLTQAILCRAFQTAASTPSAPLLAVNISPVQLRDRALPSQIEQIARDARFPMQRLMVEITESALTENLEQARAIASDLKVLGCRLALDDFGTGYSSLRHLQSLPFDEIKVDRSFVTSMTQQRESRKIVAAVVGLGQSLGLTTVAEGVETEEHAHMLSWLGCDIAQGWLCGRPVPPAELQREIDRPRQPLLPRSEFPSREGPIGRLEGLPALRLAHLQAIYDGAPVGLAFLDRSFRHVNLNRHLAEIDGLPVADHLGKSIEEVLPDLFPVIAPFLQRALQGEAIENCEVHWPETSLQSGRTFLASYQPARDEAEEIIGVSLAVLDFTERKKAEERLRQYERIVEGLDEMIVVVDRDYRYVLANRAFLDYRGISLDQLTDLHVSDITEGEIFESIVRPKLEECFRGNIVKYELRYNYPLLGERDLAISYYPVEVSGGITGAACVLRDTTEWKQMERVNQNWKKRIELAQRSGLRIGLWDWDVDANMVLWSEETYRQWGFSHEEFSGFVEDALSRIHPEDRPKVESAVQRVISGQDQQFSIQYRVVRPDASVCWIDASGVLVQDGSSHMLGVGVDITHLKQIEHWLLESEEKYRLLLDSTAEAIYGMDMEGNCTFCNPAGLRFLGYASQEDLLGKNMHHLTHHSRPDGSPYPIRECAIYSAIREGVATHRTDEMLWRSDGTGFSVEYWSHPMYKSGQLVGAVVTFLDLSRRESSPLP